MPKSKKPRKKRQVKPLSKEMIPEVEKDLASVFGLIEELSKVDFWNDNSESFADKLIKKAQKVESNIKEKYKDHYDEDDLKSKLPKGYEDYLDSEE